MKTIQRTHPLTAIAPLRPLRLWWCRILLPILRIVAVSSSLARLRFIHYGGWIVFGRLPGRRSNRTSSGWRPRPTMLFMSDYDGDPTEYLAAFGLAVALGMRWSFGSAAGFPGPQPTREFVDYVERHRVDELLRYSAYSDATVRDVDVALEVAYRMERVNALPDGDSGSKISFEVHHQALLQALAQAPEPPKPSFLAGCWSALWNRSTVSGFTVLMPIDPSREDEIVAGIEALAHDPESLFKSVGGVHFARLAILPVPARPESSTRPTAAGADHPTGPTRPCLLFSAWFDGDRRDFVDRLVTGLGHHADVIWDGCDSYPGTDDPRRLASWITAHRLRISLFLGSRSGSSAEQIQDALKLEEQVREVLTATQGQPLPEIRRALTSAPRQESHTAT